MLDSVRLSMSLVRARKKIRCLGRLSRRLVVLLFFDIVAQSKTFVVEALREQDDVGKCVVYGQYNLDSVSPQFFLRPNE